jgi:AcrR family transcriptional regulator
VPRRRGEITVDHVVDAARRCFAELGITATRMDDVARRAGISRPHLYAFVSGRAQLIELVALARLRELGGQLAERAEGLDADVAEAIADQVVATTRLGRDDPEFVALAELMPRFTLNALLTSGGSPIHQVNARIFGPLLGRAMAEGRLRSDVPVDAMVEWLQGVVALLAGRRDLDDEAMRTLARRFVLPGLLVG